MIANVNPRFMRPADYLVWEETQTDRHEYLNGEVYVMAGGTVPHNTIALNLYSLLRSHLRGTGCQANVADVKVQVSPVGPYFYPDLVVTCDDRDRQASHAICYPKMIVEVLSPSTAGFDRGDKFRAYQQISTLAEYVLIDAEKIGIDRYCLAPNGKWQLTLYPDPKANQENPSQDLVFELETLGFSCPVDLIYDEVEFFPVTDPRSPTPTP